MMHWGEDDEWEMNLVVMLGIWSKYKFNDILILKCYAYSMGLLLYFTSSSHAPSQL
jgi:hypothetical protein